MHHIDRWDAPSDSPPGVDRLTGVALTTAETCRRVYFVRHAASAPDPAQPRHTAGLTEAGKSGAARAAERLAACSITIVATSREPRATGTAAAIGSAVGLEPVVVDGLEEHHRGTAPWLADHEFRAAVRRMFERPAELAYGQETGEAARRRFSEAVARLADTAPGPVAVVTGATVICLYAGGFELWRRLGMPAIVVVDWPSGEIVEAVETV
jgi:broad specificity phosphatase PhoE